VTTEDVDVKLQSSFRSLFVQLSLKLLRVN
jgi:hypothetical protein